MTLKFVVMAAASSVIGGSAGLFIGLKLTDVAGVNIGLAFFLMAVGGLVGFIAGGWAALKPDEQPGDDEH